MNIENEFLAEVEQEFSAGTIINNIRDLRNIENKWEMTVKLKAMAPEISRLSTSDNVSVISFAKQLKVRQYLICLYALSHVSSDKMQDSERNVHRK